MIRPLGPLSGKTYRFSTATGTAFITINSEEEWPAEVFLNVGKAGSNTFELSEGIGRLVSLVLQLPDGLSGAERAKLVADQLSGIGGPRQSVPDAVAKALSMYIGDEDERGQTTSSSTK